MDITLCDAVEVAMKSSAKCRVCCRKIGAGLPRILRRYTCKYGYIPGFICYKCAEKTLAEETEILKRQLKERKLLTKSFLKMKKEKAKDILAHEIVENSIIDKLELGGQ